MNRYIRKAEVFDLVRIMEIIRSGEEFLKEQGLPQWQDGYGPGHEDIEKDIGRGEGYVLIGDGQIWGYSALVSGEDPDYTDITAGQWDLTYDRYVSIHRVAIDSKIRGRGLGKALMEGLTDIAEHLGYKDLRIDTHPENQVMQKLILSTGFSYRGMVYFQIPNGERKAYQLLR